jgi:steroid 5-alpha reductase family enzyme
MSEFLSTAPAGLAATAGLMVVAWLISVVRRDVSVVDVFWGLAIAGAGIAWLLAVPVPGARGSLMVILAVLWGSRLGLHILWRGRGHPEDRRYREIRARNEPGFIWKSLYLVFGLQAVLAWLVALPLLGGVLSTTSLGALDVLGALLFLSGFVFEAVADWQMYRFQQRPVAERGVMDRGLWRYSRHPNYFGEFCLWWGLGLMALAGGAWWSLAGPLLLSFFLLRVSGIALTEKDIASRRPDYRDYMQRTSAFIPRPPL